MEYRISSVSEQEHAREYWSLVNDPRGGGDGLGGDHLRSASDGEGRIVYWLTPAGVEVLRQVGGVIAAGLSPRQLELAGPRQLANQPWLRVAVDWEQIEGAARRGRRVRVEVVE